MEGEKNYTFILPFLNEFYLDRQGNDMRKFAFLEIAHLLIKGMFPTDSDHFPTPN